MGQLSIDFRQTELRLLETEGSAKALKVRKFRILDLYAPDAPPFLQSPERFAAAGEALGKVLAGEKYTRDPAGLALASAHCMFRDLELPFKHDEQIKKVIKFEVESSIQLDIDEVVISFFKKTETIDKSSLMVMGVRKDLLRKQLELFQSQDVDPYFADLDLLCIFNCLSATGYLKEEENFLVANVTSDTVHLLVLSRGRLISARAIPQGIDPLVRALEHDLKMARLQEPESLESVLGLTPLGPFREAAWSGEAVLEEKAEKGAAAAPGKPSPSQMGEIEKLAAVRRSAYLTKLKRELLRTLAFLGKEEKPAKIFLTGAGCPMPGLAELFKELFGAETQELDLLSKVDHSFPPEIAEAANREICVPLGAAFKISDHNATRVDFRQEDLSYAKKFDQIKVPMACFAFLVLMIVVLLNLEIFKLRSAKKTEMNYITQLGLQQLRAALENVEEADRMAERFDFGMPRINGIAAAIERKNKELGDMLGREGTIPELPSVFPVWHAFFKVLEKHKDDFDMFRLSRLKIQIKLRQPKMTFDCEVASGDDESKLRAFMESVRGFGEYKVGKSRAAPDGTRELKDVEVDIDPTAFMGES